MPLLICEIFYSIQGESIWTGLPCIFVRLSGCNLRCHYCDTQYAYDPGDPMKLEEILDQVDKFKCPRVTITGGEPLQQKETPALTSLLLNRGYQLSMETNGSYDISQIDRRCITIMDVKCPSSGMQDHNRMENIHHLGPKDQIKMVIANRKDFDFAALISKRLSYHVEAERIWLSPVEKLLPAGKLAQWMLEERIPARLQIQLHKSLWPDKTRGV